MLKERAREVGLLVALADVALLSVAFIASCLFRFQVMGPLLGQDTPVKFQPYVWILWVSEPLLLYLFRQAGLYDSLRRLGAGEVFWLTCKPFLVAAALMGLAVFLFQDKSYSRPIFFSYFLLGFLLVAAEKQVIKYLAHKARRQGYNTRDVLIVGANPDAVAIGRLLHESREYGYRVRGHLTARDETVTCTDLFPVLGDVSELDRILDRDTIDEVIFAVPYSQVPAHEGAIRLCEEVGVKIHLKIDRVGNLLSRTYPSQLGEFPMLTLASTPHDAMEVLAKRLVDVTVSAAALLIAAPIMAAAWAAIRLTSPGPAIFKQVRSGLNGRRFVLYKFRSMYVDAEARLEALRAHNEMGGPVFKMSRDPRVTPVGRWLRRWSVDEVPQFFNVLKGDMSLVGPRPPIPDEVQRYERWQRRRLSMKPGLTCLWQINGRNSIDFDEWMRLDMSYIDNWSLGLDFKILARTIPAVLFARGAR